MSDPRYEMLRQMYICWHILNRAYYKLNEAIVTEISDDVKAIIIDVVETLNEFHSGNQVGGCGPLDRMYRHFLDMQQDPSIDYGIDYDFKSGLPRDFDKWSVGKDVIKEYLLGMMSSPSGLRLIDSGVGTAFGRLHHYTIHGIEACLEDKAVLPDELFHMWADIPKTDYEIHAYCRKKSTTLGEHQ